MTIIRACRNLWIACVAGRCAPLLFPLLVLLAAGAGIYWLGSWARATVVVFVTPSRSRRRAGIRTSASPASGASLRWAVFSRTCSSPARSIICTPLTRRAQQTAAPVANQFGLPINLLASNDWPTLARRIKSEHRGETVVVVAMRAPCRCSSNNGYQGRRRRGVRLRVRRRAAEAGSAEVLRLHYGASVATATPAAEPERT